MSSAEEPEGAGERRVAGRRVRVTPAFDSYWRFAHERQELFFRRLSGLPPPWTADPVIAGHRFTNVFRASDRVSQYLIRHVIYDGDQSAEEVFFRTVLFKLFNRIGTWARLAETLGELSWRSFDFRRYAAALDVLFAGKERIYSAAYIMPSPSFGERRKHANHLRLVEHMMRDGAPRRLSRAASLAEVFGVLRGYRSLGDFLAFQLAIDLNYGASVDFSEMEFVVAGPGARDGIRKCFPDLGGLSPEDVIRFMAGAADREFDLRGLSFRSLWGRPLQLIDCQNVFCELSKYARVIHPEVAGTSGRTRIKQKYSPTSAPVPQWYPPKWGLNAAIAAAGASSERSAGVSRPVQQELAGGFRAPIVVG
jgi:hypothetical protein